jgi:hypothetical protein
MSEPKFLRYISDGILSFDGDMSFDIKRLPKGYSGEVLVSNNIEFIINVNSKKMVNNYLKKDKRLTKKLQEDFDNERAEYKQWSDWRINWIIKNIKGAEIIKSGNTYNYDNHYF